MSVSLWLITAIFLACIEIATLNTATVAKIELWVQLQKYLFHFARVIKREVRVDADVLRDALHEVPLDLLILLVLLACQLATQRDNQL